MTMTRSEFGTVRSTKYCGTIVGVVHVTARALDKESRWLGRKVGGGNDQLSCRKSQLRPELHVLLEHWRDHMINNSSDFLRDK